jgi:hypothetical protein
MVEPYVYSEELTAEDAEGRRGRAHLSAFLRVLCGELW